jgi:biotin carboxyl carrier protein
VEAVGTTDERGEAAARGIPVEFAGRGLWVWNADELEPDKLAAMLAGNGFQYYALKAHDGTKSFRRNERHLEAYSRAARRHGLAFGLWGYLKADDAVGEARFAAELVRRHGASFYLADAEGEYERAVEPVSKRFAKTFRKELPSLPAALSSFGRVDLHPDIDWAVWREHDFEFHPQAYECDNHQLTPARCVAAAERHWPRRMIRPTVGAYKGAATRPSAKRLAKSLEEVRTRGFNVWRAGTATDADFRALAKVGDAPATNRAHRDLHVTDPYMHGPDVLALQIAINRERRDLGLSPIGRDGDYGPITHEAAWEASWYLGVGSKRFGKGAVSVYRQKLIRHPDRRNAQQVERGKKRRKEQPPSDDVVRPLPTDPGRNSEFAVRDAEGAPANNGNRYHAGKDWFAPGGTPVRAPVAGEVIEAKPSLNDSGQVFGGTAKIRARDGKVWVFRHVVPKVRVGERVDAGDGIARVTKWRGGPSHAHIEVWKTLRGGYDFENMIDPMKYFR